jgi:predicted transcriptional regulator
MMQKWAVKVITPLNPVRYPLKLSAIHKQTVHNGSTVASHWNPKRKLDRSAMQAVRQLYAQYADAAVERKEAVVKVSRRFGVSYEAIKRILQSRFQSPP